MDLNAVGQSTLFQTARLSNSAEFNTVTTIERDIVEMLRHNHDQTSFSFAFAIWNLKDSIAFFFSLMAWCMASG